MSVTGSRTDPYMAFNFLVTFVDATSSLTANLSSISTVTSGFSECSGLESTLEVEEFKEGGNNGTVLKFPTRNSYSPIRLKRGITRNNGLWDWYYSFVLGQGQRRDGLIILQNEDQEPVKIWQFVRGIPTKYSGPTFNATQGDIAVEELEITHEGITIVNPGIVTAGFLIGALT